MSAAASFPSLPVPTSGERFSVGYRLTAATAEEAADAAREICLEQTIELPGWLVPPGDLAEDIVGRLESLDEVAEGAFLARISYPVEAAGGSLIGLLNVVYSNVSMKLGIRVEGLDLPASLLNALPGPRFGQQGVRDLLSVPSRPLLGTAIKPMGFPAAELARIAYQFAAGGLDIIKDDHSLVDQTFARFKERAARCAEAVREGSQQAGGTAIYAPNITAGPDRLLENAYYAKAVGAGALEIMPGLAGLDAVRLLASQPDLGLPILTHPSMLGTYTLSPDHGAALWVQFAEYVRLAGGDLSIFTSYGGRFPTTQADCRRLIDSATRPMGHLKPILPMPGGGMTLERVPELLDFYGRQVVLLISGGLFASGPDLVANCQRFRDLVEAHTFSR